MPIDGNPDNLSRDETAADPPPDGVPEQPPASAEPAAADPPPTGVPEQPPAPAEPAAAETAAAGPRDVPNPIPPAESPGPLPALVAGEATQSAELPTDIGPPVEILADTATSPAVRPEAAWQPAGIPESAVPVGVVAAPPGYPDPAAPPGFAEGAVAPVILPQLAPPPDPTQRVDPLTGALLPPAAAVPPPPRRSYRRLWRALLAAAVVAVLLVAGYTVVRYLVDNGSYDTGHEAYGRADCAAAIGEYDSVINSWKIVTLGSAVAKSETEKAECLAFKQGADLQQAGNRPAALVAYAQFVPGRPASPLTEAAHQRVAELFGQPDLVGLATVESCDVLNTLRSEKMLVAEHAPAFLAACGAAYFKKGQRTESLATYARLFTDYGKDKAAADAEAAIIADTSWCLTVDQFRSDPVLSVRGNLLPGLLVTCITSPNAAVSTAMTEADEFLQKYPGHPRTGDVIATLAQLVNKVARNEEGDDFGAADVLGTVGGDKAVLMVYNDADEPMRIALSGPEPRVEMLDACPTCPDVTDTKGTCRKQAVAKRIVITPGEYDLATKSPPPADTRGGFAHWALQPGKAYFLCVVKVAHQ